MPDPLAVVTARPGDTVIFVMPARTTHEQLADFMERTKDRVGTDVKLLFVAGAEQVVHLVAEGNPDA